MGRTLCNCKQSVQQGPIHGSWVVVVVSWKANVLFGHHVREECNDARAEEEEPERSGSSTHDCHTTPQSASQEVVRKSGSCKQCEERTEDAVQVGEVGREVEGGVDRHEDPVESNRQPVDDVREPVPFTAPDNEDR